MSLVFTTGAAVPLAGTAPPHGLLDRLDPRTRVLAAFALAALVVWCGSVVAVTGALVCAALLAALARLPVTAVLRRLAVVEGFMVLTLATLPFTMDGETAFALWDWTASWDGLHRAGLILLKSAAITVAVLALLGTLPMPDLGHALARLGAPKHFVVLFLFAVRYVDVLYGEYARLRLAMRARAFRPRLSLHAWVSLGHLIGMVLVSSLDRAERIHAAMRCRGFDGRFHLLDEIRPGRLDWGFGAAQVASLVLLALLDGL